MGSVDGYGGLEFGVFGIISVFVGRYLWTVIVVYSTLHSSDLIWILLQLYCAVCYVFSGLLH